MTLNRFLTVAGFLLAFAAVSHANDLSQLLSSERPAAQILVCNQGAHTSERLTLGFGGVSK